MNRGVQSVGGGRFAGIALLLALVSGCVTTTEGGFTANKQQEIDERVGLASGYMAKGDYQKAVAHLRRALELDPDAASIHDTLAQVFWRTGEYELAYEHFQRAISVDPKFSRARNNYAAFLFERGDIDGAIRQLEQVTSDTLYEKRGDAFANLGRAYARKGEMAKAEESFSRAVKMGGRQSGAMLELAEINFGRADYAAAQRYYAQFRASSTRPSPRSLLLGIRIARATGDRDAEASYALQMKGLYPDSDEYRQYQVMTTGS